MLEQASAAQSKPSVSAVKRFMCWTRKPKPTDNDCPRAKPGKDIEPLGTGWIDDIVRMIEREADNLPDFGLDD